MKYIAEFEKKVFFVLFFFPIAVLSRSFILNLYFVFLSLAFLTLYFFQIKEVIKNNKIFILIFCILLYLVFISFFAEDIYIALKSSSSQVRFFLFVLLLSSLVVSKKIMRNYCIFTSFLILIVSGDTLIQYFLGFNLFGLEGAKDRLSGLFGDELIVGTYIFLISIPIISNFSYEFKEKNNFYKIYYSVFYFICLVTILLSGERMSLILFLLSSLLIFFYNFKIKNTLFLISFLILLISVIFNVSTPVKNRFTNFYQDVSSFNHSNHFRLFTGAYHIWNENKFFGVGLKNYRYQCDTEIIDEITKSPTLCSSHPHNFYLEFLAEAGLIGFFLYLFLFIYLIFLFFKKIKYLKKEFKGFYFGCLIIIITYAWPIKSSGSFFSTFTASFFWFNLGLLFLIINSNKDQDVK